MGFVWLLSPLALGFQAWPNDPAALKFAHVIFWFSYWVGLPLLLVGQAGSLLLAIKGNARASYRLPVFTFSVFLMSAAIVLLMVNAER